MNREQPQTTVQIKDKSENREKFLDDLRVEKEIGTLFVYFLLLLGIAAGCLSLFAIIAAIFKFFIH